MNRSYDTCTHLKVPANTDVARHYFVCTVVTPLPANMHFWDRDAIEGRVEGAARWITREVIEHRVGLRDCCLHHPTGDQS